VFTEHIKKKSTVLPDYNLKASLPVIFFRKNAFLKGESYGFLKGEPAHDKIWTF
jgi:hypothetical protein